MVHMRSLGATRRQFLTAGGVALAGAVLSGTAAWQQGLAYSGIFVSQPTLFSQENADTRLPVMGANHTVLRWGNPYTNFVGYVNGSDWGPTGFGVYWPVIVELAHKYGLPNAVGGEGFAPGQIYSELGAGPPV